MNVFPSKKAMRLREKQIKEKEERVFGKLTSKEHAKEINNQMIQLLFLQMAKAKERKHGPS